MKIAVTSTGPALDAQVHERLGRCDYFVVVDPETKAFEAVENGLVSAGHGAGTGAAQLLVDRGVDAVLTGNCGPKAYEVLGAAGIRVYAGVAGTVREAVEQYRSGKLVAADGATVPPKSGAV